MDRDGLPLRNEAGDIICKDFPPTNKSYVFEDKDHVE